MRKFTVLLLLLSLGRFAGAWEIVLPEQPTAAERNAAAELRHYLELAAPDGVRTAAGGEAVFHLGDSAAARQSGVDVTAMPEEAWVIRSSGSDVVLAGGGQRGTLYAIYHFLEDIVGVRWWNQLEESVPRHESLQLPELNASGKPFFRKRDIYRSHNNYIPDGGRFAARSRLNRDGDQTIRPEFGGAFRFGSPYFVHTFDHYFPEAEYFAEHPDYYALRNGQRIPGANSQLCLTNPELQQAMAERLLEFIRQDTEQAAADGIVPPIVYDISANDCRNPCECERCAAVVRREGSEAGPLLECLNFVAARLTEKYPDKLLHTLAYYHTEPAPRTLRPRENLIIQLCDTGTNQARSFQAPENRHFVELLKKWAELSNHLAIWDYSITYSIPMGPFPHEYTLADNMRTYQDTGVEFLFFEHEGFESADMHTLNVWLEAKLMENPDADFDALLEDFYTGYYGAAAPFIHHYRELLRDSVERHGTYIDWFANINQFYHVDLDTAVAAQALFDQAEAAVANDPVLQHRVRRARLNLDLACAVNRQRLIDEFVGRGGLPEEFPLDRDQIATRARDTWLADIEAGVDPDKKERYRVNALNFYDRFSKLEYAPKREPEFFAGQKYIALDFSDAKIWSQAEIRPVIDPDSEAGYVLEVTRGNELPLQCAMYVPSKLTTVGGRSIAAAEVTGPGYHWYRVARVRPQMGAYVYFLSDWTVQFPLDAVATLSGGETEYDLWASVKFTGPGYPAGSPEEASTVCIERIVLVQQ